MTILALFSQLTQDSEGLRGVGPLGLVGKDPTQAPALLQEVLSKIIGLLTGIAIIFFVFQFLSGAVSWLSAGGDPKAVEGARMKITNAVVGFILVVTALALISLIGFLLGIEDILNIADFVGRLGPGQ